MNSSFIKTSIKASIKTICSIFMVILYLSSNVSIAFPQNSLRAGGLAILPVAPSQSRKPVVRYHSRAVALVKGRSNWLAIIGISLKTKAGTEKIIIKNASGKTHTKYFKVKPYHYRTQRLSIKNKNKVNPNKKSQQRINREFFLKQKLKTSFSNRPPHLNFIKPTAGRDSGRFGLKRILNKQKRSPHSGMDIAAPSGRKVKAAATGKVLFTGNLFFTGNVVYLDHGNGLISLYAHLSKILVKKGQNVKQGEIIGRVGKTGRVTGPHLHWSVYLNGNAIDPALFIKNKQ